MEGWVHMLKGMSYLPRFSSVFLFPFFTWSFVHFHCPPSLVFSSVHYLPSPLHFHSFPPSPSRPHRPSTFYFHYVTSLFPHRFLPLSHHLTSFTPSNRTTFSRVTSNQMGDTKCQTAGPQLP
ncbi:hypothetical protein BDQ17DRAFT_905706 [Cyathus striatus]|nr:hypothetical protein BDQ17DRAFT_905706 [Cyathus striatus]